MATAFKKSVIKQRFIEAIRHHLSGWKNKANNDFSPSECERELNDLTDDPIYANFNFATLHYVAIRKIGRMSISIGRRLGEIYDKVPRFVTAARFNLTDEQVKEKFGRLELDIAIRKELLDIEDATHVENVFKKYFDTSIQMNGGLGIEIRYNFNPNDSSRLRKDVQMCERVKSKNLTPIYLIFSRISPRNDAISRLTNSGWHFLVGEDAISFMKDLLEVDFQEILQEKDVQQAIKETTDEFMETIFRSELVIGLTK